MEPIKKFNRFELKYLLSIDEVEELKKDLEKYLLLDDHGKKGIYAITSLYYDTEDYRFYWEKIEGIKFRRKLRIRFYETIDKLNDDSIVFVEIKQRQNKTVQKRRIALKYSDALLLCNDREIPPHKPEDMPVIEEILSMIETYNLRPTLITSYFRQAYVGSDYDLGLRITFDTNIRYRINNLSLSSKEIGNFIISPDKSILEIKANERIPYWVTEIIGHRNYRLIRISKYCTGLEVAQKVPNYAYEVY
ncbi:MAG: polyphosphate polymerase domain-containing protein [Candidatus Methanofastidiosa archaeon]|jgi:SPX domain protein involved in polyphosphate accumulation|nr:polyphosphate polymerase domain-containing protein [Candidatus Methanofastidiosa archaeon]